MLLTLLVRGNMTKNHDTSHFIIYIVILLFIELFFTRNPGCCINAKILDDIENVQLYILHNTSLSKKIQAYWKQAHKKI